MDLEQALAKIAELETEVTGLKGEKTALISKRDELLGKLVKLKKFEAHADLDIDELLKIKELHEASDSDLKTKYETAYKTDKAKFEARLEAIENERKAEAQAREQEKAQVKAERTRAAAIAEFSKADHGVFNAEQLFRLVGDKITLTDAGKPVVGDLEMPLPDFIKQLRADPDYQNQFKASGVTGSGSTPGVGGTGGSGAVNPWKKETFNLTQQGRITRDSPQLAAAMKQAAGVK